MRVRGSTFEQVSLRLLKETRAEKDNTLIGLTVLRVRMWQIMTMHTASIVIKPALYSRLYDLNENDELVPDIATGYKREDERNLLVSCARTHAPPPAKSSPRKTSSIRLLLFSAV